MTDTRTTAAIDLIAKELQAAQASYNGYGWLRGGGLYAHMAVALASKGLLASPADEPAACARCGCTEDQACDGGCFWIANELMLDLCSECIRPDGSCTTPNCGYVEAPLMFGWILVHVAGSEQPARYYCSPWCADRAMEQQGTAMAAADLATAAGPEKDTRGAVAPPSGESTPSAGIRYWRAGFTGEPVALGRYDKEPDARAHCEAALSAEHTADVALLFSWIAEADDPDEPRELVSVIDGQEQRTGYMVTPIRVDEAFDPACLDGEDW